MKLLTLRNSDTGQVLGILGIYSNSALLKKAAREHNKQTIKSCRFINDKNKIKPLAWQYGEYDQLTAKAFQGNGLIFHSMPMILDGDSTIHNSQVSITAAQIFNLFPALEEMKIELEELGCPVQIRGHEETDLTSISINIGGDHPVLGHIIDTPKKDGHTTPER